MFLLLLGYTYLIIGAYYSHPNAEDLSLTAKPLHFGVFHAIKHTLLTYDGRYFTNVLHTLNPLAWGWLNGYKWQTIFTILLLPLSLFFFLKNLLVQISNKKLLAFSFLFCLVNYSLSSSLPHQVFWMASSFVYTYSWIFWFLWVGAFLNFVRTKKHLSFILALLLLVLSNGINEMFLVINCFTVFIFLGYYLYTKQLVHEIIALLLSFAVSFIFFVSNPGIILRFNSFSNDRFKVTRFNVIIKSLKDFILETSNWFLKELIFISFIIFITLFFKKEINNLSHYFKLKYVFTVSIIMLLSIYFSSYAFYIPMGFQNEIPYRIFTSIDLGIQLLFSFVLSIILAGLLEKFPSKHIKTNILSTFCPIIIAALFVFGENNISLLKKEFDDHTLLEFDSIMASRYQEIQKSKSNKTCWIVAEVPKINKPPKSIYSPPDIQNNKEAYYWNNAYEKYFLIDEVRLVGDSIFDCDLIQLK